MPGAGSSMLSVGRPRARQRRFDTQQPSFEDENPEQDMPDFSDTDSESDEEQTDQQKPVESLITEKNLHPKICSPLPEKMQVAECEACFYSAEILEQG